MKALIIHAFVGISLFAGSLVGGLWLTGRLNHEGTANIPVLGSFFPAPAVADGAPSATGADAAGGKAAADAAGAAPAGETAANAALTGAGGKAADASGTAAGDEPQNPDAPRRQKTGKSVVQPEKPDKAEGAGGGADAPQKDKGGEKPVADSGKPAGAADPAAGKQNPAAPAGSHPSEQDFTAIERSLADDKKNKYAPGGFFVFEGMPAGLTPEQINEAWQRVQGVLADLDRKKTALELREQELQELADDIGRRQRELGAERETLNLAGRALDEKIAKFQEQVKLVRNDEVAALKRNAETLASFEASKGAELVTDQWKTEKGQDEVLKTFEFMEKDAVNAIIDKLANPMIQDVLKKRLRVSKEAMPSGGAKR